MNFKKIGKFIGYIALLEVVFMIPALIISLVLKEQSSVKGLLAGIALALVVGVVLVFIGRRAKNGFHAREGLVCVGIGWFVMSLIGCVPFWVSGEIPHFVDALFEIVSGFTTTGASILANVEGLSKGLIYWRSFSHWVGGMGVLVFLLAIIPAGERNSGFTMYLLKAESPGPNVGKLVPKMRSTAGLLYGMYIALTIANIIFLLIGHMPVFDSFCIAFGCAGTGGFGIKNDSMASYSPYLQNVCTVFMLLFGVNFNCYYLLFLRKISSIKSALRDEEVRTYFFIFIGAAALIAWNIRGMYPTVGETIRHAAFQVSSIMTTTGFSSTNFDLWPTLSKTVILCLMIVGACAGSTGGGFKVGRFLLIAKDLRRSVHRVLNPHRVQTVRMNRSVVPENVLENANAYLAAYALIVVGSILIISKDGFSIVTNLSAVLSCFNNIGPGLDVVGPLGNFASYSVISKVVLIIDMLAGRLEIFPILILFSKSTWKRL